MASASTKTKAGNVMIDIETLATTRCAAILSVGACTFEPDTRETPEETFYVRVDISEYEHSLPNTMRRITNKTPASVNPKDFDIGEATVRWWKEQSDAVRNEAFFAKPRFSVADAMTALAAWLEEHVHADATYWCKGTDFDFPILAHAFAVTGQRTPWKFYRTRDVRTVEKEADIRPMKAVNKHNALTDCLVQVDTVQRAREVFRSARPNKGIEEA